MAYDCKQLFGGSLNSSDGSITLSVSVTEWLLSKTYSFYQF